MADQQQTAVLSVLLNGEQAKSELKDLRKLSEEVAREIDKANAAGNKAFAGQKTKELQEINKNIKALKRETIDVTKVINNLSSAKPRELSQTLSILQKRLNNGAVKRGSTEWNYIQKSMHDVRMEMKKIQAESAVTQSSFNRISSALNKHFLAITSFIGVITGLSMTFRRLAEDVAKMDDIYADVMKTTGMTRDEVLDLNEAFKQMDTRTSREQLNLLARDAGKLGITGKDNVLGFVRAANQIQVALGEDLGDGAIRNIGKITEVYRKSTAELNDLDIEGRMLAVGSAINELGQSSTAQEKYLVDFTQRLGGIGSQAGLSVQNVLGFASALDQFGEKTEMSATALQKFIMKILSDPAKFARIAGMEVSKFSDLIKYDMNSALLAVLKNLNGRDGLEAMIPILQEVGLDAARAAEVVSALAGGVDRITEAQNIANTAFAEASSLTDEYNIKNNNLMAKLEKARKKFKDMALELGERLNPILLQSTKFSTILIKTISSLIDWFDKYGGVVIKTGATIAAYTALVNASIIIDKLKIAWNAKVVASFKRLYATIMANPLMWVVGTVVALGVAITSLIKKNNELAISQNAYKNIQDKVNDGLAKERSSVDLLVLTINNQALAIDKRRAALDKLKKIIPGYLADLTEEGELINNNTDAIEKYLVSKEKEIRLKAVEEEYEDVIKNIRKQEQKIAEAQESFNSTQKKWSDVMRGKKFTIGTPQSASSELTFDDYKLDKAKKDLELYKALKDELETEIKTTQLSMPSPGGDEHSEPKEGDTKTENGVSYIFKGGKWVILTDDNTPDDKASEQKKRRDAILKKLEIEHLEEMSQIKQNHLDGDYQSEYEYNQAMLDQQKAYDDQRKEALEELLNSITDPDLRTDITKQIADINEGILDAQIKQNEKIKKIILDADPVKAEKLAYENRLRELGIFGKEKEDLTADQLAALEFLEKQHEENMRKLSSKDAIVKLKGLETEEEKAKAFLEERRVREQMTEQQYKDELLKIELDYLNKKLEINGLSAVKIEEINKEIVKKMADDAADKNRLRESLLDEYGLRSAKEKHEAELATLQYYEEQGISTHEEALKAKKILDREYFDELTKGVTESLNAIAGISGNLSSAVSGFQEAEISATERKYNKQIKAAGNNSKKVAKLEEEKEKEVAAIKAKHADKQFIISVAQIISTTAVSAMEAYKAMAGIPVVGPALGAAAAAAAVAYGASQIAVAKEQKEAAKAGYWGGGYTPRGPWDKPQGVVHSEEFIGNRFAVRNPTVRKVFDIVDQAQKNNTVSSLTDEDFSRALNYREAENRHFISGISSAITAGSSNEQNDVVLTNIMGWLGQNAEVIDRLNKRLDDPFVGEVSITGKKGINENMELYDKMKNNATR